jgi:chromosome condensin MukBEF complex kleisin-like MukF subunit
MEEQNNNQNENTIAYTPTEYIYFDIIEQRKQITGYIRDYLIKKSRKANSNHTLNDIRAYILGLYLTLKPGLVRKKVEVKVQEQILQGDFESLVEVYNSLNQYLDDIQATRLDKGKLYELENIESYNRSKGF